MLISDIIPYERNARDNADAVPAVAESIREFGLRGQIILESPENPVIVAGHTRVEACRSLGWTEIPDENIAFCDDLDEEQVRAFRLADNKTAEVARWNRSLERSELDSIKGIDMSRFAFDRQRDTPGFRHGDEALRTDRSYNLHLVSRADCDPSTGVPRLDPVDVVPDRLVPFNYARSMGDPEPGTFLHFYKDDYQFTRVWNEPERYLPVIQRFAGAIAPDFSLYADMPEPMQRWNVYRSAALGWWWQRQGVAVVPNLTWAGPDSYGFCFDAVPEGSTVAVAARGVRGDPVSEELWRRGMAEALRRTRPSRVLVYGSAPELDFGDVEVVRFRADAGPGRRR